MESIAGTEHVEGFRGFSFGTGDTLMAAAFKIMMDQGLLAMVGHCAARRVSPWIPCSGHLLSCQGTRGLQGHEEDVFLDGLPPLSLSRSEISTIALTPRVRTESANQTILRQ